jgi:hypothetical protein
MSILSKSPSCTNKIFTVGDALDQLEAFNAVFAAKTNGATAGCGLSDNDKANWRNAVRDGVINCAGRPTELNFFASIFPYDPKRADATDLYIKYRCDIDYNVYSQDAATGSTPGGAATFTIMRGTYAGGGKYSNVSVGGSIYIYEDKQWVSVTAVSKTTDFAHTVTVVPFSQSYTVNIRSKKQMMFSPVDIVGAYSQNSFHETWEAPGYVNKISPLRVRKDWVLPLDLKRPYQDVMQFALTFDRAGKAVDNWELYQTTKAREELIYRENLSFFIGQKIDNPALLGTVGDAKYPAYDGYIPTMYNGGGTVYDYDPTIGFDLEADYQPLILRQNAKKKSKNFMVVHGLNFIMAMNRRNSEMFKNSASGALTLQTFKQMGLDEDQIAKLSVSSYSYLGYALHFKEMDALTDTRSIGNYNFPWLAMMFPMDGNIDSNGNPVPPIEFFQPFGNVENGAYYEVTRQGLQLQDGKEEVSGTLIKESMMGIHCPQNHILLNPVFPSA